MRRLLKKQKIKSLKVMKGQNNQDNRNQLPKGARIGFGIFMVIVYIGVGLLFFLDVFTIDNNAVSYTIGGLLCAYGVFRAYRLYIGNQ